MMVVSKKLGVIAEYGERRGKIRTEQTKEANVLTIRSSRKRKIRIDLWIQDRTELWSRLM